MYAVGRDVSWKALWDAFFGSILGRTLVPRAGQRTRSSHHRSSLEPRLTLLTGVKVEGGSCQCLVSMSRTGPANFNGARVGSF